MSAEFTSNNLDVSAVAPVCRGVSSLGQVSLLERSLRQSEGDLSWVALGQEGRSLPAVCVFRCHPCDCFAAVAPAATSLVLLRSMPL